MHRVSLNIIVLLRKMVLYIVMTDGACIMMVSYSQIIMDLVVIITAGGR